MVALAPTISKGPCQGKPTFCPSHGLSLRNRIDPPKALALQTQPWIQASVHKITKDEVVEKVGLVNNPHSLAWLLNRQSIAKCRSSRSWRVDPNLISTYVNLYMFQHTKKIVASWNSPRNPWQCHLWRAFQIQNDANEALKLQKAMPLQGQYLRVKPPSNSDNLIGFMFGFRDPYWAYSSATLTGKRWYMKVITQ